MYSRLQRNYDKRSQKQVMFYIGGSVILIILLFMFGIPLLFNLTGTISSMRRTPTKIVEKTLAPNTPVLSQGPQATSSAKAKITGVADPKITVEVFQNNRSLGTTIAESDGTFTMDTDLEKGSNVFTAMAANDAGQKSSASDTYSLNFLSGKPKLDISSPKDGDSTNSSPTTISGLTDPGDSVTINDRLTIVNNDGKFYFSLDLNDGDNKLKVVSTDPAGNQSTKELTIKYQH